MKPGSLVVFIGPTPSPTPPGVKWVPEPNKEVVTIREIVDAGERSGSLMARFEEGCMGINPDSGREWGIGLEALKEIQPPEEGELVLEEFNDVLKETEAFA